MAPVAVAILFYSDDPKYVSIRDNLALWVPTRTMGILDMYPPKL